VTFLEERNLITLSNELGINESDLPVKKKTKSSPFIQQKTFAICNFDLSLLPIKLNLPMVCKPINWKSFVENPTTLADVHGDFHLCRFLPKSSGGSECGSFFFPRSIWSSALPTLLWRGDEPPGGLSGNKRVGRRKGREGG
jgi:hypothetical protein